MPFGGVSAMHRKQEFGGLTLAEGANKRELCCRLVTRKDQVAHLRMLLVDELKVTMGFTADDKLIQGGRRASRAASLLTASTD